MGKGVILEDGVAMDEEFLHDGHDGDLLGFTVGTQVLVGEA